MRRALCFFMFGIIAQLFSALAYGAPDDPTILRGEVRVNEVGGALAPGVRVLVDGKILKATDSAGQFVFSFRDRKPGDTVKIAIVREGWAIVNDMEMDRELPSIASNRRLIIIISKAPERQQWAIQYYRLRGREDVEDKFRRKIAELEKVSAANSQEIGTLRRQHEMALQNVEKLALQIASQLERNVDPDIVSKALRFYADSRFDEALQLLSDSRLEALVQEAEQDYRSKIEVVVHGYRLRGQMLATNFQFDESVAAFARAAELAPQDWSAQFDYGQSLEGLNRFDEAQVRYERALLISRNNFLLNPEIHQASVAKTLNSLGVLYRRQNRFSESIAAYSESLAICRVLAKIDSDEHRSMLATVLNNMGGLYGDKNGTSDAISALGEAVQLRRDLFQSDPVTYRRPLAISLINLANVYIKLRRSIDARPLLEEALSKYRAVSGVSDEIDFDVLAQAITNLGALLSYEKNFAEATLRFQEALELYSKRVEKSPEKYRVRMAMALNNLGVSYQQEEKFSEADACYQESLGIYRNLADVSPKVYRPDVARSLNNLGYLYLSQKRLDEARLRLEEALQIYRSLNQVSPDIYRNEMAALLSNYGALNMLDGRTREARLIYEEALLFYEKLAKINPAFRSEIDSIRNVLISIDGEKVLF